MARKHYMFVNDRKGKSSSNKYLYGSVLGLGLLGAVSWALWSHFPKGQIATAPQVATQIVPLKAGLAPQIVSWQKSAQELVFTEAVPQKFQKKVLKEVPIPQNSKIIALTFDDGPWPVSTAQILDILKKENIKATFFILGQPLQEYPQIAKQVVAGGHAIGNHTWHHWYKKLDANTSAKEIEMTNALIYKTLGIKTHLFRPPGGILNNGVADYAKKKNYFVALWSSDSMDYHRPGIATLVKNVMKNARPGGMILMHDGGGDRSHTVKALPIIIAQLKKQGYQFVTVPELLEIADTQTKATQTKAQMPVSPKK